MSHNISFLFKKNNIRTGEADKQHLFSVESELRLLEPRTRIMFCVTDNVGEPS